MVTHIISCLTLENELKAAMKNTGTDCPVLWLESGLHNTPAKLNARLCEEIGKIKADRIILAMGFCGNSLPGIRSEMAEIIVPRVDDCISLLLGGMQARKKISSESPSYFLTEGWLKGERNLWVEYQYSVDKFGKEEADAIAQMMYGHYRTLALLDTGISPAEELWEKTEQIEKTLHLERKIVPGTLARLEELLTGPWDAERYLILPPGKAAAQADMKLEQA